FLHAKPQFLMKLVVVGISHRTAPVELRERVDFNVRGVREALVALAERGSTREAVIVSTCNRAEIYAACDDAKRTRDDVARFISDFNEVPPAEVAPRVQELVDLDAARHLFRVAGGLDSLVVGEPQILGQVKEAHTAAAEAQTVGPMLNRLFHSCFAVGKRVRTETGLASGAVSVSYAAVALARKIFGDLKGRTVLVIGAGEMGKLTARHMKSQGVQRVMIVSRTMAHAARTAEAIGGASEVLRAEAIVTEEVGKFGAWLRSRGAIPTVVALRQKFENIRRAELERLDFKLSALPPEARPDARACVDEITRLIVEKLLL